MLTSLKTHTFSGCHNVKLNILYALMQQVQQQATWPFRRELYWVISGPVYGQIQTIVAGSTGEVV